MIHKILRFFSTLFSTVVLFMAFVSFYAYVRSFYIEADTDLQTHLTETESPYQIIKEDTPIILEDISYELSDARICREKINGSIDEIHFTDEELSKQIMYYNGNLKVSEPYQYIWISIRIQNLSDCTKELSLEKPIIAFNSSHQTVNIPAEIRFRHSDFFDENRNCSTVPAGEYAFIQLGYLVDETSFSETKLYYPLTDERFFYLGEIER